MSGSKHLVEKLEGNVWRFGDNINTDLISPAEYMDASYEVIGKHAMEKSCEGFADKITKGDVIVAGNNFGSGSSRETAQIALLYAGVGAVIAKSFARIFFRNCINCGLPVLTLNEVDEFHQGDRITIDLSSGKVINMTSGKTYFGSRLSGYTLEILQEGGLKAYLKKRIKDEVPRS